MRVYRSDLVAWYWTDSLHELDVPRHRHNSEVHDCKWVNFKYAHVEVKHSLKNIYVCLYFVLCSQYVARHVLLVSRHHHNGEVHDCNMVNTKYAHIDVKYSLNNISVLFFMLICAPKM
jgi:hypothetical protein